jgi:hypothetical protein
MKPKDFDFRIATAAASFCWTHITGPFLWASVRKLNPQTGVFS